jgi:DNA-binding NtrC family response regulator
MALPKVMMVSSDPEAQAAFSSVLDQCGFLLTAAPTAEAAGAMLGCQATEVSLVFCSDELPGGGIDRLIRQCLQMPTKVPLVVVSRFDDWKRYLDFLRAGAFDYLLYPASGREIERIVKNALDCRSLAAQGAA